MGTETIQVSGVIHASPDRIYQAWLDSEEHSRFTGGKASVESGIGGKFTAWDGYIQGTHLELEPGRRIVQSWRTTEFPSDSGDSRVEIHFEPVEEGTRIVLFHSDIPTGQGSQYEQGWKEHYLEALARYFANQGAASSQPAQVSEGIAAAQEEAEVEPKAEAAPPKKLASKPKAKAAARKRAPKRAAKAKKVVRGRKRLSAKAKAGRSRKAAPKRRPAKRRPAKKAKRKASRRRTRR